MNINQQCLRRSRKRTPNGAVRVSEKQEAALKRVRTFSGNTKRRSNTTGTERTRTRENRADRTEPGRATGRLIYEVKRRALRRVRGRVQYAYGNSRTRIKLVVLDTPPFFSSALSCVSGTEEGKEEEGLFGPEPELMI